MKLSSAGGTATSTTYQSPALNGRRRGGDQRYRVRRVLAPRALEDNRLLVRLGSLPALQDHHGPVLHDADEQAWRGLLDIRARDAAGRWLNIEMQVTVFAGLLPRLVYYACSMYVDQLQLGQSYADLRSAISICLLNTRLFREDAIPHHRFRLADPEHGMKVSDSIEVHTVELTKYNLREETISSAPAIEQWAFFFLFADRYEPERLRALLPGVEFQQAISVVETIAAKTEDRMMYDQRLKAQRDYQWGLDSARQEGLEKGALLGKIQMLQQLLGEEPSSTESLGQRTIDELSTMLEDLQQRLRSREP